jgi:hypothetical protein
MAERRALFEQWDEHVTRIGGDLVVKDVSSIRALVTRSADNAAYEITSSKLIRIYLHDFNLLILFEYYQSGTIAFVQAKRSS